MSLSTSSIDEEFVYLLPKKKVPRWKIGTPRSREKANRLDFTKINRVAMMALYYLIRQVHRLRNRVLR